MLQTFRVKPSSRLENRNTDTPVSHHHSQPILPFNNHKIKLQKIKHQQRLEIKQYKSRAQVSRKKMDTIPLLKNMRFDGDKISILRSAQNQYKMFMKKPNNQDHYNDKILVINGQNRMHRRSQSTSNTRNQSRMRATTGSLTHTRTSSMFQSNMLLTMPEHNHSLSIAGKPKNMSPSRSGSRWNERIDYHELKI